MYVPKASLILLAAFLSACCRDDGHNYDYISYKYGVCLIVPSQLSVGRVIVGEDFEHAKLIIDGVDVELMVGGHPDFPIEVLIGGIGARDGFKFIGRRTVGGVESIMFGHDYGESKGPLFVVFSSIDLAEVENTLMGDGVVVECDGFG